MPLTYTFTKYKDVYTLQNTGVLPLTYSLTREISSENFSAPLKNGVLTTSSVAILTFPVDGVYKLLLDDGESQETIDIRTYNNLLVSFITVSEKLLCGCAKCNECEECNECEDYLGAFMKAYSFNALSLPLYQDAINLIPQYSLPDFEDDVVCTITKEKVYGSSSVKEPMLKILSYYYAAFYSEDFSNALDQEERDYINIKYKIEKISKCIKKLGINITDILNPSNTSIFNNIFNNTFS